MRRLNNVFSFMSQKRPRFSIRFCNHFVWANPERLWVRRMCHIIEVLLRRYGWTAVPYVRISSDEVETAKANSSIGPSQPNQQMLWWRRRRWGSFDSAEYKKKKKKNKNVSQVKIEIGPSQTRTISSILFHRLITACGAIYFEYEHATLGSVIA